MALLPEIDFRRFVSFGREQPAVEFKGSGSRQNDGRTNISQLFARVVRAMLAMANQRDGGWVIVGITEANSQLTLAGLSDEDVRTWRYDDVASQVREYADPNLTFQIEPMTVDEKVFVVIRVSEFDEIPIVCKGEYARDKDLVLRRGALYVRSRGKIESREVQAQEEMRALIDLATEKMLAKQRVLMQRTGLLDAITGPSDAERFNRQLEEL